MNKNILSEEMVQNALKTILNEEISKVNRQDFNRVQFKIEELQNSLIETIKELRKLEDSVPDGLKTILKGRISQISSNLNESNKLINQLRVKIKEYKKNTLTQQVDEKKK